MFLIREINVTLVFIFFFFLSRLVKCFSRTLIARIEQLFSYEIPSTILYPEICTILPMGLQKIQTVEEFINKIFNFKKSYNLVRNKNYVVVKI